jgi:DNA-binding NarL/FixJ family response regulator
VDTIFDVVVSDVVVFGGSISQLPEHLPSLRHSRLVTCSRYDTHEQRAVARAAGSVAFLTEAEATRLPAVVDAVRSGVWPLEARPPETARRPGRPRLTARESQVLVGLDEGLTTRLIARSMGISDTTVKGYSRSLFAKLDVHSRAQAVYVARRQGLLHTLHSRAAG